MELKRLQKDYMVMLVESKEIFFYTVKIVYITSILFAPKSSFAIRLSFVT